MDTREELRFEWLEMTDTQGAYAEGPKRQLNVMEKDGLVLSSYRQ